MTNLDIARECGADIITHRLGDKRHIAGVEFTPAQLDAFAESVLAEQTTLYALLYARVREQDVLIAQLQGGGSAK